MNAAISVDSLGKKYLLGQRHGRGDGLRHVIEDAVRASFAPGRFRGRKQRKHPEDFWALRDVSFAIKHGEAVGIIGRNGAGKSTLLKLLSRITEPTTGQIRYKGRVASLLEVGTGFHAELTGRENISLNAAILGMSRADVARRFDEIVAFAEVEKFLDTPVKRYSTGMYVRLAFGVAAHLEPDILLVDEVLAVGDAAFQRKCLGKMDSVVREGRTVLFVSHNMAAVSSLCTRAMLIVDGRLQSSGSPDSIIKEYLVTARTRARAAINARTDRRGDGRVRFTSVSILNDRGEATDAVSSGEDIAIALEYALDNADRLDHAVVQIKFFGTLGQPLFACLSRTSQAESLSLVAGGRLLCGIPKLPLGPGTYTFTVWCTIGGDLEDLVADAGQLFVTGGDYFGTGKLPPSELGDFLVAHSWGVEPVQ